MINFIKHKFTTIKEAPLQYLDEEVREYLLKNGRTKELDDDILCAAYISIDEDNINGCKFPPLWFARLYLNLNRRSYLKWYYKELEKKKKKNNNI